jgi:hypothetical protein
LPTGRGNAGDFPGPHAAVICMRQPTAKDVTGRGSGGQMASVERAKRVWMNGTGRKARISGREA